MYTWGDDVISTHSVVTCSLTKEGPHLTLGYNAGGGDV